MTGASAVPDTVSAEDFGAIRDLVREFVRLRVVPREQELVASDAVPEDLRAQAARMGLFGCAIPAAWGGLGLDLTQDVELAFELGYTCLGGRTTERKVTLKALGTVTRVRC